MTRCRDTQDTLYPRLVWLSAMTCGSLNSLWHWLRLERKYLHTLQLLEL